MTQPTANNFPPQLQASDEEQIFETTALIALQSVDHLGSKTLRRLLASIDSVSALIKGQIELPKLAQLSKASRLSLLNFLRSPGTSLQWEVAEKTVEWLALNKGCVLTTANGLYPKLLQELDDCPPILFVMGNESLFKKDVISIVGTRKPTASGYRFATQLAKDLTDAGWLVCSGMAMGIDTAAHIGALQSNGETLSVWATGLDNAYPTINDKLAKQIVECGAVVTEMPLGTNPVAGLFPRRNRIVSGLSAGVIVVEAERRSGSLITANLAAEQNREVFAVPGPVQWKTSQGCHHLIKQGAALIESADDVLATLSGIRSLSIAPLTESIRQPQKQRNVAIEKQLMALPAELRTIYEQISVEALPFEIIANRCKVSIDTLNMALVDLELMGLVLVDAGLYSQK